MLFAKNITANLQSQADQLSIKIAELEIQLQSLREEKTAIENEKQALETLAQAGQSALEQSENFLKLAQNRPDMIEEFWTEMDKLRNAHSPVSALLTPEPTPPTNGNGKKLQEPLANTPECDLSDFISIIEVQPIEEETPIIKTQETTIEETFPSEVETEVAIETGELKLNLSKATNADLRNELRSLGLSDKGKKQDLIDRLMNHYATLTH